MGSGSTFIFWVRPVSRTFGHSHFLGSVLSVELSDMAFFDFRN